MRLFLFKISKKRPGTDLNRRPKDFQSSTLPTELPGLNELSSFFRQDGFEPSTLQLSIARSTN
jgi:hypothetical protein